LSSYILFFVAFGEVFVAFGEVFVAFGEVFVAVQHIFLNDFNKLRVPKILKY